MKIMLDAGHGYSTPGKRSPDGMQEYEFNRVVAQYTKQLLEKYENVTVYFSHSDERDVPLQERTNKANQLNVDLFISIHANAYGSGGWNNVSGIETYVYITKPKMAYELAKKVQKQLILVTGLPDRGVKTANFHVLRETRMTAILCELGFMTNKRDMELLRSDAYRKACAEAIVKGVQEQYKLTLKKGASPNNHQGGSTTILYKVQVGAFKQKKNAEEFVNRLKRDGYLSIITLSKDGLYRVQVGAFKNKTNANNFVKELKKSGYDAFITQTS